MYLHGMAVCSDRSALANRHQHTHNPPQHAPVVYSLHKTSTRGFLLGKGAASLGPGVGAEVVGTMRFALPATYKFHRQRSVDVEVGGWGLGWCGGRCGGWVMASRSGFLFKYASNSTKQCRWTSFVSRGRLKGVRRRRRRRRVTVTTAAAARGRRRKRRKGDACRGAVVVDGAVVFMCCSRG